MMDIFDDCGRKVIQNAVFTRIITTKLVGVGGIPLTTNSRFSKVGEGTYMGSFNDKLHLMSVRPAVIPVRGNYVVQMVKGGGDTLVPVKRFMYSSSPETIDDTCYLRIEGAEQVTIFPYQKNVSSADCQSYNFLRLNNSFVLAKIPLPNHFNDGQICIGTGVKCREIPAPMTLIGKVIESIDNDKYNKDLADADSAEHLFSFSIEHQRWEKNIPFEDCNALMNESLVSILPAND